MSTLFTPLKLGSTTIPNRIGMSALTRNPSTDTVPNEIMLKYYVQRAKGGAGLIVSEGILITPPGIWDNAQVEGWKLITDAVHKEGSKIYAQVCPSSLCGVRLVCHDEITVVLRFKSNPSVTRDLFKQFELSIGT
ncbi:NADH:flavin oxidoreductase/NADH oxidase [Mycena vitilis]|nr:NADH:flavin oxidoreductase/NADH oxidase [Mycena vitilis]